jgi:5'-3' exonuclease
MGISRLESIIRNSNKPSTASINGTSNGIYNICLKDLPHLANSRKYPQIRTVVIDTSEFIYKSIIGGDHTSGILNFLEKMFRCQLMPIFVFDGKPPKEKTRIIEDRKKAKARARAKVISLNGQLELADELLKIVDNKFCGSPSIKKKDVDTIGQGTDTISQGTDTISLGTDTIGQGTDTISLGTDTIGQGTDTIGQGTDTISQGTDTISQGTDTISLGTDTICSELKTHSEGIDNISGRICAENSNPNISDDIDIHQIINYQKIYDILGDTLGENSANGVCEIINEDIIDRLRIKISDMITETEKINKKMVGINESQYKDIKNLFNQFNIPFIHAGVEAEMICAALVKLGIADYCIGNDMDLFALGCPRIIRNINFRDDFVDVYYLENILDNLELTYTEFVDLCIALGSDYTGRFGGVKNYHILEYIQKYKSIENILANIDNINCDLIGCLTEDGQQRELRVPEPFNFIDARAIFATEFTIDQINSITSFPLNEIYENCANKCLKLRVNFEEIAEINKFCQAKCGRLNNMLITKKINTIIWSNLFQDEKTDGFILVKNKKSSPISINGRRTDIINDIRAKGRNNFSRVAFGSSPNHAMLMQA